MCNVHVCWRDNRCRTACSTSSIIVQKVNSIILIGRKEDRVGKVVVSLERFQKGKCAFIFEESN
jgi:hypothetical protein